jgi:hypothetical protein
MRLESPPLSTAPVSTRHKRACNAARRKVNAQLDAGQTPYKLRTGKDTGAAASGRPLAAAKRQDSSGAAETSAKQASEIKAAAAPAAMRKPARPNKSKKRRAKRKGEK